MLNPYDSPSPAKKAAYSKRSIAMPLVILICALLLTEVFATINTIEEGYPFLDLGTIFLILIAGVSQLPGLLIAPWCWKRKSAAAIPMLFGAFMIALTGCGMYALYAFDGKADSINASTHMHVIVAPFVHCVLAAVIYLACGIVSAVLSLLWNPRRRDEQSHALGPAARLVSNGQPSPPAQ